MATVDIIGGPFAGQSGTLIRAGERTSTVRMELFGRAFDAEIAAEDLRILDNPQAMIDALRGRMAEDRAEGQSWLEHRFWLEQADAPEADPLDEHRAWQAALELARAELEAHNAALDAAFEAEIVPQPDPREAFRATEARWLPEKARRDALKAAWRADPSRFDADRDRGDRARQRRRRAEGAADEVAYAAWRTSLEPDTSRASRATAARARVEAAWPAITARVLRDWGLILPRSLVDLWVAWESLGREERQVADDLGLSPLGVSDLLDEPEAPPAEGLDARLHGRYYRDPPEFLTFLHGGDDGLHYGLWFDTPDRCAGVCRYYNNDGIDLAPPRGSPLGALRQRVRDAKDGDPSPEHQHRLRLLLEALPSPDDTDEANDTDNAEQPDRLPTLDGAGALAPGHTPWDAEDLDARREALRGPDVEHRITEAERALAQGEPAAALVLGRDLHWLGRPEAGPLLIAAYQALGRPALAEIARVHHQHRDLSSVGVLRRT